MTGFFLLLVIGLWLWFVWRCSGWMLKRFSLSSGKQWLRYVVIALLIPLPVIDEIIGGMQFKALCKKGSVLKIDAEKIKGKTVRLVIQPSWKKVEWAMLPIYFSIYQYQNNATKEEYARYVVYNVEGGKFIRLLGISEGNAPLTIRNTSCSPVVNSTKLSRNYEFNLIN